MINIKTLIDVRNGLIFKQNDTIVDEQKTVFEYLHFLVFFELVVNKMSADDSSHELKSGLHHCSYMMNGYSCRFLTQDR